MQLLLLNVKKNQILLLFWGVLFLTVTGQLGRGIGLPYLFLDPEYQNEVGFTSLLILGVAVGLFTVSFFITSYILDSRRYLFLGTVRYPFICYSLNNSLIPAAFLVVYLISFIQFQLGNGLQSGGQIAVESFGFFGGLAITITLVFLYFTRTNRPFFDTLATGVESRLRKGRITRVRVMKDITEARKRRFVVSSYIGTNFRFHKVDQEIEVREPMVFKVFDQHHLNAVAVELVIVASIIILGIFRDNPAVLIPAAASGFLLFSFLVMFTGAFSYWLRGWAISGMVLVFFGVNLLFKYEVIDANYAAFGLNYRTEHADYSLENMQAITSPENVAADQAVTIEMLENWRAKFPADQPPKMVFVLATGGGQRSSYWTVHCLQQMDKSLSGEVMNQSVLMTGASGGLIGMSYYRELYLREQLGQIEDRSDPKYLANISKDLLNPMIFSLVVSDLFFRVQKFDDGRYRYPKGRGYAFELQLNRNTDFMMDRRITDYAPFEQTAQIPMMIMAPIIVNDARKLYIGAQPMSYMSSAMPDNRDWLRPRIRGVEFRRMFAEQDADNLRFTSALRMSATFPYVTPNVTLPSLPEIEIMDAGLADNYGISDAVRFLYVFREWIEKNTSGVVFVSMRDNQRDPEIPKRDNPSLWGKFSRPFLSLLTTWDFLQDFANTNYLEYAKTWYQGPLDVVYFAYDSEKLKMEPDAKDMVGGHGMMAERASLSWHLTTREKEHLNSAFYEDKNQASLRQLQSLLQPSR